MPQLFKLRYIRSMARRRREHPLIENIRITGMAEKGRGVGRDEEGRVYFVKDTAPGDVVDVQVVRSKKSFREGFVAQYRTYSSDRTEPFCPHFNHCGGCSMQHISYARQLMEKQQMAEDAFTRIGHLVVGEKHPILESERQQHYRNKLEFAFSAKKWLTREQMDAGDTNAQDVLGFHPAKAFDKVLDMEICFLQEQPSENIRRTCLELGKAMNLAFYDNREHRGFLRQLVVRVFTTGQVLVIVGFGADDQVKREEYLNQLLLKVPEITSLHYFVNTKMNDFFLDLPIHCYFGPDKVEEKLGDIRYAIGPKSFFQTNTRQAKRLYDEVLRLADLQGTERIYDLYTGLGSIALYLAPHCGEIVGIEEVPDAIEDARENAILNQITNAHFYAGDVKKVMDEDFIHRHGRPDILITDPPRAGMHADVVASIRNLAPQRIIYVSCNPATQARDIDWLGPEYEIVSTRAVDLFPHTHHVENIAYLVRKPDVSS